MVSLTTRLAFQRRSWRTRASLWLAAFRVGLGLLALTAHGQPRLSVGSEPDGDIRIAWSVAGGDFQLEETGALGSASTWIPSGLVPSRLDDRWVVDLRAGSAPRFFRLAEAEGGPTRIAGTSPATGEERVAVTRETIVRFTRPLASTTTISTDQFHALFGGRRLLGRVQFASDRRSATLFHLEPLPGGALIRVTLDTRGLLDEAGRELDGDGDGTPGGSALIDFRTLDLQPLDGTAVAGRVFASELAGTPGGEPMNIPLAGVTITVDGREETLRTVTDAFGNFRLAPVPPGAFFVHVDGRTALRTPENSFPEGAYYPSVGKRWFALPGEETTVGNVYLPLIAPGSLTVVSAVESTGVAFPAAVLADHPELEGVELSVPANALYADDGRRGGRVGIAPVAPDRLPSPLPRGLMFPLVITVQTDGASNFDAPVPVCFPNLPDPTTGFVKAPGTPSALWSFNHDIGDWEVVGPMTVSADGRLVCSDPGFGILQPGWHGERQGSTASGGDQVSGGGSDSDSEPENGGPDDVSDPVYLFSGEFYVSVEDLRIPGRGTDFMWIRKYRSRIGPNTAQGNGWDHSYNVSIEVDGEDIFLRNGHSRTDRYSRQTDGTYSRRGHFRELVRLADGTHSLTFEDTGRWQFHAFDGSPSAGRLLRIIDRNGNTLRFSYDSGGRLVGVTDTLDRDITLSYDGGGRITRVTDFSGRVLAFSYYDGSEPGGGPGDLKSVTTPAIVGTPTGNDFPAGKTTTYTYTTGFADERLNHNLLTITDGRRNDPNDPTFGQGPWLVNVYTPAVLPDDPNFDRVARQVLGGDVLDYVYVPQLPSLANGGTVTKTIANDRNGNVREYFYDSRNRMVRKREYSGRADPRQATTEIANRPVRRLRPGDPPYFETRYDWNEDSLQRRIVPPNGNATEYVYESDLNPGASPRTRGNLRILRQVPGAHLPAGEQASIEERYEYDPRFGGAGFISRIVDGRGNATEYTFDARGNRTRIRNRIASIVEDFEYNAFGQVVARVLPDNGGGHRRRDEYAYHDAGPQRGYLREWLVDATGFRLPVRYTYDVVGNLVGVTDSRGNETRYVVNAQNQVVRVISREVRPGSDLRYQRDQVFDANNNLVRINIQNIGDDGVVQPNSHITVAYEYEVLNNPVRVSEEVDATRSVLEEYTYDGNRNRVLTRYGEAIHGSQPANVRRSDFDERDLEYRVIRAPGDPAQSTTQFDYDRNGNLSAIHDGLEDGPRSVRMVHDGYNRPVTVVDPLGNVLLVSYDPNDNLVRTRFEGETLDSPGSTGNVRLSDVRLVHDPMNRVVRTESQYFDTSSQSALGPGTVVAEMFYNGLSQVLRLVDGNGNQERRTYDTASRLAAVVDAGDNSVTFTYDANDNVLSLTQSEVPDGGGPAETFVTAFEYDGLDRRIRTRDSAGNIRDFGYDSRDNVVFQADARRAAPEARGNLTRFEYDGLRRLIRTITTLTADGSGAGAEVGSVILRQSWDDSNRLATQTDPLGNTTTYAYDPLNRERRITYADGTARVRVYDVHGNVVEQTDPNGSQRKSTFDLLNRLERVQVIPGPGVASDLTFETYRYDGLSRLVHAEDDDSLVTRTYDSFSRIRGETQNGKGIAVECDPLGNALSMTYPGGRTITTIYDALNRKKSVSDAEGVIASYQYAGPERVRRRSYGNGTVSDFEYDGSKESPNAADDHGVRRLVRTAHARQGAPEGGTFDNRTYTWDRMFNKSSRVASAAGGGDVIERFNYDSLQRLVRSTTQDGGAAARSVDYELDGAGNRRLVAGGSDPGAYSLSSTVPEPADAQLNQYTSAPDGARRYDRQGNLTRLRDGLPGQRDIQYDARNQMVAFTESATGATTTYAYDAFGRRIGKSVKAGPEEGDTRYFYTGWQVCEEQGADGGTRATYVHGNYLDEVLSMRRGGAEYFFHADDQFSVVAVTDAAGEVVERYEYEDYGRPHISDAGGFPRAASAIGNPYRFTGRRWDSETGFYYYRTRYLEVGTGRFTTRDTLGIWGDAVALGNGFTYVGNNPWTSLDPMGEGLFQMLMGNNWDDPDSELFQAAGEGLQGGSSIVANTMTFGATDKLGVTQSDQYQGRAYDASRFAATVSREALLTALTAGANAARGGACALGNMGKLAPLIEALQATKHGPKIASLIHKILEAINTGRDAADLIRELQKLTQGNGSLLNAIMSGLGVLSGIDGLRSLPGFCFAEGTEVLSDGDFIEIEAIRVGDRVATSDTDDGSFPPTRVDPRAWRLVELLMPIDGGAGGTLELRLLRSPAWIRDLGVRVGARIPLLMPEQGIEGIAWVVGVHDCPPLQVGPGRVVLGTFRSRSGSLVRFTLADSTSLTLTRGHPLFSEDRGDWTRAGEFRVGDSVRTRHGSDRIVGIENVPGEHDVHNLQVETDHCYYVSRSAVLSHNTKPCPKPQDVLSGAETIGRRGSSEAVRMVETEAELRDIFKQMSQGGTDVAAKNYDGRMVQFPDGTRVGLRESSKSGGATIDIFGGGKAAKIHFDQPH